MFLLTHDFLTETTWVEIEEYFKQDGTVYVLKGQVGLPRYKLMLGHTPSLSISEEYDKPHYLYGLTLKEIEMS